MATPSVRTETELFPPLARWLEDNGFVVHAEVNHCDVAARKGDDLVLIEMKRALTLDLILQALRRQTCDAAVYVAVPPPPREDKRWREILRLLKRLELGLLVVVADSALPRVEVRFHPVEQPRRKTARDTRALLTEMNSRSPNQNVGGSNRRAVMTAYREQALDVAVALEAAGPCAPRDLRRRGTSPKTGAILTANHYGWFERLSKGIYGLTEAGRDGLARYAGLADALRRRQAGTAASAPSPEAEAAEGLDKGT